MLVPWLDPITLQAFRSPVTSVGHCVHPLAGGLLLEGKVSSHTKVVECGMFGTMQPAVLSVAAMHGSTWWLSASCKARHTDAGVCLHSPVLQSSFCTAFKRASPDFQTRFGYGVDPPNQANMAICSNQVGVAFVGWLFG